VRIRSLDEPRLGTLLEHERKHAGRTQVLELLRTRLEQVAGGAELSPGDPERTPLRRGMAEQTQSRGRP
jgi:hypothetical protein